MNCQHPSPNHSENIKTIWHGSETPLHLCGYHALMDLNATLRLIKERGQTK